MARLNLAAQLDRFRDADGEPPTPAEQAPATEQTPVDPGGVVDERRGEQPKKAAKASATPARSAPKVEAVPVISPEPLYLRLERKETRLREDQISDLAIHARRLNKAKGHGGDRITENTLIRVAIDLLLAQVSDLHGADEAELRNSVSLQVNRAKDARS